MRKTWRPKFKVGDFCVLVHTPPLRSAFLKDDTVRVLKVDGRKRMSDLRHNRYLVNNEQVSEWVFEDYLDHE